MACATLVTPLAERVTLFAPFYLLVTTFAVQFYLLVTTTAVQFNLLVEVHCWSPALHSMQCMSVFCTHHVVIGPAWYKMVW